MRTDKFPGSQYTLAILCYQRHQELDYLGNKFYTWFSSPYRATAVNAMIYLCHKLQVSTESIFVATSVYDRFFMKCQTLTRIQVNSLLCCAMVSFMIALKYLGELYKHCSYDTLIKLLCFKDVSSRDLIYLENRALCRIGFDMSVPTMKSFLPLFLYVSNLYPPRLLHRLRSDTSSNLSQSAPVHSDSNSNSMVTPLMTTAKPKLYRTRAKAPMRDISVHVAKEISVDQVISNSNQEVANDNEPLFNIDEIAACLSERLLLEHDCLKAQPSRLAAACVLLARRISQCSRDDSEWNGHLQFFTLYQPPQLEDVISHLLRSIATECKYFRKLYSMLLTPAQKKRKRNANNEASDNVDAARIDITVNWNKYVNTSQIEELRSIQSGMWCGQRCIDSAIPLKYPLAFVQITNYAIQWANQQSP